MPDFGEPLFQVPMFPHAFGDRVNNVWPLGCSEISFICDLPTMCSRIVDCVNTFASIDLDNPDFETLLILRLLEAKRKGDTTQRACVLDDYFQHAEIAPTTEMVERFLVEANNGQGWYLYHGPIELGSKNPLTIEEAREWKRIALEERREARIIRYLSKKEVIE